MKKLISLLLALVMIFTFTVPVFADSWRGSSPYPIIRLCGNGEDIVDADGNLVYNFDYDTSNLADDVVEVCMPNLLTGIATGDFSDYYDALYDKLSEIYGDAKLDKNGNPTGGTNIPQEAIDENERNIRRAGKSSYGIFEYEFRYDWRLDPFETADKLNEYINAVLASTKKDKVSIHSHCLGGTPVMAYLEKYGSEKIDTVCFDAVVTNGCEMINDTFTANMTIDSHAALRFAEVDRWNEDLQEALGDPLLFDLIYSTIKMLNTLGLSEEIIDFVMDNLYNTFGKGVTGVFARAGLGTWPSYWSAVEPQNYELAKTVVFGEEGSDVRAQFAGLIAKLDNYYEKVTLKIPEILQRTKDSGTKVFIVAKYGYQLFPYYGSTDELSDAWVSLSNASMNATTCPIGKTFTDKYIASQEEKGLGKYICVDKTVDASTCALPDNTWFVKGADHENWAMCIYQLAYAVCTGAITDINSDPNYPQFLFYDKETGNLSPLTQDNMNCEDYYDVDTGTTEGLTKKEGIFKKLQVFFEFLANVLRYLVSLVTTDKTA